MENTPQPVKNPGKVLAIVLPLILIGAIGSIFLHKAVKDRWAANLTEQDYIWCRGELEDLKIYTRTRNSVEEERAYQLYLSGEKEPFRTINTTYLPRNGEELFEQVLKPGDTVELKVFKDQYNHQGHWGSNPIQTIYFTQPPYPIIVAMKINGHEIPEGEYSSSQAIWLFRGWRHPVAVLSPVFLFVALVIVIITRQRKKGAGSPGAGVPSGPSPGDPSDSRPAA